MSAASKTSIGKSKSSGKSQYLSSTSETKQKHVITPSEELILPVGPHHVIELTMKKNRGQKHASPAVNSSPGQKTEKKKSTGGWGDVFRQQSVSHVVNKQYGKCGNQNEVGVVKKDINVKKQQKSPVKCPMKSGAKQCTTLCGCSSVLVRDRAVQCEIYNSNKLSELAIDMLHSIKELKGLVSKKDEKQCEILTKMEHLCEKLLNSKSKTDFSTATLKDCKKIKTTSDDLFILEREKLHSEILIRAEQLREIENKCSELSFHAKTLTQQLNKATSEKNDVMSLLTDLRRQHEDNKIIITNLETNLTKQTELAHKNDVENKLLTMEINKISIISLNQEKLINGYRTLTTDLKNQIAKQLKESEGYKKEDIVSPQMSLVYTGLAYSSPTSSFSDGSNESLVHDLSISSVDSVIEKDRTLRKDLPRDSELVSLLDEGSSYTMLDQNGALNYKGSTPLGNNENNINSHQNVETNNVSVKKSFSKSHNKENEMHNTGKFTRLKEQRDDNTKNLFLNASKTLENVTSVKSTNTNIRRRVDMLNQKPVNVPSLLRDCPRPDWSDSSLLSISTVSSLNLVPSQTTSK
ncbi:hypothetical protein PUN28_016026 [Cardiocondyla obscurior]|uniref:Uncharacterized protein n=2 Tax=Cardiocondyla obscurior TaxID=286306 RepID=A0AAW2EVI6_9HYME